MNEKCFACGHVIGQHAAIVDTRDGQIVRVGRSCYRLIARAGERGYKPPKGGPRLWVVRETSPMTAGAGLDEAVGRPK